MPDTAPAGTRSRHRQPHRRSDEAGTPSGAASRSDRTPVALTEIDLALANQLLEQWDHYLGPCRRPFGQQAWCLAVDDRPVAMTVSASSVSAHVIGPSGERFRRRQLVELARLCSAEPWATRVMVRLWREVAARHWPYWHPDAAIAYSLNHHHDGRTYRFDGWTQLTRRAGSAGGGTWTTHRSATSPARAAKTLWLWDLRAGT
jgi:hypothetical protein